MLNTQRFIAAAIPLAGSSGTVRPRSKRAASASQCSGCIPHSANLLVSLTHFPCPTATIQTYKVATKRMLLFCETRLVADYYHSYLYVDLLTGSAKFCLIRDQFWVEARHLTSSTPERNPQLENKLPTSQNNNNNTFQQLRASPHVLRQSFLEAVNAKYCPQASRGPLEVLMLLFISIIITILPTQWDAFVCIFCWHLNRKPQHGSDCHGIYSHKQNIPSEHMQTDIPPQTLTDFREKFNLLHFTASCLQKQLSSRQSNHFHRKT